jgi:hypothetical protein
MTVPHTVRHWRFCRAWNGDVGVTSRGITLYSLGQSSVWIVPARSPAGYVVHRPSPRVRKALKRLRHKRLLVGCVCTNPPLPPFLLNEHSGLPHHYAGCPAWRTGLR